MRWTNQRSGGAISVQAAAAIRLLMLTGCRKNEILTLRWRDVDLEAMELHLADTKAGSRTASLSPEAAGVADSIAADILSGAGV